MTSRFDEYFNFLEHDDDPMNMSDSVVEEMEKIIESMPPKLSDFSNTDVNLLKSICSNARRQRLDYYGMMAALKGGLPETEARNMIENHFHKLLAACRGEKIGFLVHGMCLLYDELVRLAKQELESRGEV